MDSTESVVSRQPFIVRRRVRWGDCDPAGVVYTGRFPEYLLGAVSFFTDHIAGGSMHALTRSLGVDLPCKGMTFEFISSLWPNDVFDIQCEVSEIRSSSFDIACTAKKGDGALVFKATFSPICIEIKNSVRTRTPIPQEIREAVMRYKRISKEDQ